MVVRGHGAVDWWLTAQGERGEERLNMETKRLDMEVQSSEAQHGSACSRLEME
jgi:hypothetical protein